MQPTKSFQLIDCVFWLVTDEVHSFSLPPFTKRLFHDCLTRHRLKSWRHLENMFHINSPTISTIKCAIIITMLAAGSRSISNNFYCFQNLLHHVRVVFDKTSWPLIWNSSDSIFQVHFCAQFWEVEFGDHCVLCRNKKKFSFQGGLLGFEESSGLIEYNFYFILPIFWQDMIYELPHKQINFQRKSIENTWSLISYAVLSAHKWVQNMFLSSPCTNSFLHFCTQEIVSSSTRTPISVAQHIFTDSCPTQRRTNNRLRWKKKRNKIALR